MSTTDTLPAAAARPTARDRTRLAAYAWAEQDDAVLLCRMGPEHGLPRRWTLPGGGIDFGEDPVHGLLRELEEETGLTGRPERLVAVRSVVLEPGTTPSGDRIHAVGLLWAVSITGGELRDEPDGSTDRAAWVARADLDALPSMPLLTWARAQMGR